MDPASSSGGGVVRFEEFEHSKENILPLCHGRDPKVLQALFGGSAQLQQQHHQQQQAQEQQFETQLKQRQQQPQELLVLWQQYLAWSREHHPTLQGKRSPLLALYERCTAELLPHFRSDSRYAQLWLEYSCLVPDPLCVYQYMEAQAIGASVAAFYIAWATCHERRGQVRQAQEVFRLGHQRGATPQPTLLAYHTLLLQRHGHELDDDDEGVGLVGAQRQPFTPLPAAAASIRRPMVRVIRQQPEQQQRQQQHLAQATDWSSRSLAAVSCYVDQEEGVVSSPSFKRPRWGEETAWAQLPVAAERRKENAPPAARWNNNGSDYHYQQQMQQQTVPTSSATRAPAVRPIQVYCEEENEDEEEG